MSDILRFPLLGEDWRVPPIWAEGMTATVETSADGAWVLESPNACKSSSVELFARES